MAGAERDPLIPNPYYTLINTLKGRDPAVVVVNVALRDLFERELLSWHLRVTIECRELANKGMPTMKEVAVLERMEDVLSEALERDDNAAFFARVTWRGQRELIYRVHDPEAANDVLTAAAAASESEREWEYRMEHDPDWVLTEPEFSLVDSASAGPLH